MDPVNQPEQAELDLGRDDTWLALKHAINAMAGVSVRRYTKDDDDRLWRGVYSRWDRDVRAWDFAAQTPTIGDYAKQVVDGLKGKPGAAPEPVQDGRLLKPAPLKPAPTEDEKAVHRAINFSGPSLMSGRGSFDGSRYLPIED